MIKVASLHSVPKVYHDDGMVVRFVTGITVGVRGSSEKIA